MVANSLFLTIAILLALGFWLLGELKFFIPYKTVLFHEYGTAILVYLATLFLNLLAAAFVLNRKFFLKDTGRDQAIHHGFAKPREAHHDADLYRMYHTAATKIQRQGGRNLRVILDYELKKRVYHDIAKVGSDRESPTRKKEIAEKHGLQLVRGRIPLPDLRIEYETPGGEMTRVDLELATEHYRGRNLAEKVRAGFSIYAYAQDAAGLRRVLDQRELTAEILSL